MRRGRLIRKPSPIAPTPNRTANEVGRSFRVPALFVGCKRYAVRQMSALPAFPRVSLKAGMGLSPLAHPASSLWPGCSSQCLYIKPGPISPTATEQPTWSPFSPPGRASLDGVLALTCYHYCSAYMMRTLHKTGKGARMRRLMMLVTVVLIMAAVMMTVVGSASAQGGCQAFGHSVADDAKEFRPLGTNFVSGAAPLADLAHAEHAEFCG